MKRFRLRDMEVDKEDFEANNRWIVSYADFITLLLAFFIISYFALVGNKKVQAYATAIKSNLRGGQPTTEMKIRELHDLERKVREWIKRKKLTDMVDVNISDKGLAVTLKEKFLFSTGGATLSSQAANTLGDFGEMLRNIPFQVRIEGHADNVPIATKEFPSNWHLSVARATSVLMYLVEVENVQPDKISAAGFGEFHPKFPNDTPEHRALNRRVDVVILSTPYKK